MSLPLKDPNNPTNYKLVDGFPIPSMFPDDSFRSAVNYKPTPEDIFIVTYPKCGTTWAQQTLTLIFRQGVPIDSHFEFFAATPFLEVTGADAVAHMHRPGVIKVHLPFHLTPWSEKAKYIYVTRNPKDCCVSYFHHMRNIPMHGFTGSFSEFFEIFLKGNIDYGDYFDHLMGWYKHSFLDTKPKMSLPLKDPNNPMNYQLVDGFPISSTFPADSFRSAVNYKPTPEGIFIVTYPMCGTTWAQQMLTLIFRQGVPIDSVYEFFAATPFLEVTGADAVAHMHRPGVIKVHLPFHLMPWSEKAKYIYVTRNPKDSCVSYFHHMRSVPMNAFTGTFSEFFEIFLKGNIAYGDYFDHFMGWYKHRNDPNVLFLTYEEMKENPEECILKMASFMDDEAYAKPLREDPQKMDAVLKHSSFNYMKENFNKSLDQMFSTSQEDIAKTHLPQAMKDMMVKRQKLDTPPPAPEFVRKGIVGDWRNYLSEDQSKRMDERFAEETKGTDVQNFWKNYM